MKSISLHKSYVSCHLLIGGNNDGLFIHVGAVSEHLIADEADVLEGERRLRDIEYEDVSGCLAQTAVAPPR